MDYQQLRRLMVERQIAARGIGEERLLQVLAEVPRHLFVPEKFRAEAYEDHPLPIGQGQTISQPFMVAVMTAALRLQGHETVLEIGTGSGYQAAVLASLARRVLSVERLPELAEQARANLARAGVDNVELRVGDGSGGWPEHAPYQGILVTAGAPRVPEPLLQQLAPGARLVIPVGDRFTQVLEVHTRLPDGGFEVRRDTACRFVDLIGRYAWQQ